MNSPKRSIWQSRLSLSGVTDNLWNDERQSIVNSRHAREDEDETGSWSVSSNGGLSRSSHDSGAVFQNVGSTHPGDETLTGTALNERNDSTDALLRKKTNYEEYLEMIQSLKSNKKYESIYDGVEEILADSDSDEDDERLFNDDDDRMSFTREQLVEYQHLTKLLRFVKGGGRCTTILSLAILRDHDLQDRSAFLAFKDANAIGVMLNFIEMFDRDLKLTALYVLRDTCQYPPFAYEIFRLGGILTIIDSMTMDHVGMQESCAILLELLVFRRARRVVRRFGAISKLLTLLDELSENIDEHSTTIAFISRVLLFVCKSDKNKFVSIRYGIGKILSKILPRIPNHSAIPIVSLLTILLQIPIFAMQMRDTELTLSIIQLLDSSNLELARISAESLYYLSFDRHIYPEINKKLYEIFRQTTDPSVFCSISNTLTRLVDHTSTIRQQQQQQFPEEIIRTLVKFFQNVEPLYLKRIIQSLVELTKISRTIDVFKQENIFPQLIHYLKLLTNENEIIYKIVLILQESGNDREAAELIIEHGGLQELWTLFKLNSLPVKIAAGWTIRNCLASTENNGELIRSFDGIFYLLLNTLSMEDGHLLASTLAIIAELVKDEDNRQILTDLGLVSKLSQLNNLDDIRLRKPFCNTVANLLDLPKNREEFGNRQVMITLKNYMTYHDSVLNPPLTKAIYDLSLIPSNCILLHDVGAAPNLLKFIADDDPIVQEKSARALRNMRKLLDANRQAERASLKDIARTHAHKAVDTRTKCIF